MHVLYSAIKSILRQIYWNVCAADYSTLPLTPLPLVACSDRRRNNFNRHKNISVFILSS